jgi:hypothetical protein
MRTRNDMTKRQSTIARRDLLKLGAAASALGVTTGLMPSVMQAQSAGASPRDRKLLFVICAFGGASIIDSFMPVLDSDAGTAAPTLNCYPERLIEQPAGSGFRTVKILDSYSFYAKPTYTQANFVSKHGRDMAVLGHEVSSVNHNVGQQRALNGGGFDRGRSIMESVALRYGASLPLPNVNMAIDGYAMHGADESIPLSARHETVMTPQVFASGTHGYQGVAGAPAADRIARARKVRAELEQGSRFGQRFARDARLNAYLRARSENAPQLEEARLIEKLLLIDPKSVDPKYGVTLDPLTLAVRSQLKELDTDRVQAQVGLAFLMAYHGVSTALTVGFTSEPVVRPSGAIVGTPLSYDFSHNMHRVTQSMMWSRTLEIADALISLLKTYDYMGDPALGKMWDRSLVYVATEFGRDKTRPSNSESWGSGHDLNNGSLLVSPLLKGNAVYGGVDPRTGLTHGFDPQTGLTDKTRKMTEADVYGIIAQALGIEVPGGKQYPGVVRG